MSLKKNDIQHQLIHLRGCGIHAMELALTLISFLMVHHFFTLPLTCMVKNGKRKMPLPSNHTTR
jgi:hypothetical protein